MVRDIPGSGSGTASGSLMFQEYPAQKLNLWAVFSVLVRAALMDPVIQANMDPVIQANMDPVIQAAHHPKDVLSKNVNSCPFSWYFFPPEGKLPRWGIHAPSQFLNICSSSPETPEPPGTEILIVCKFLLYGQLGGNFSPEEKYLTPPPNSLQTPSRPLGPPPPSWKTPHPSWNFQ